LIETDIYEFYLFLSMRALVDEANIVIKNTLQRILEGSGFSVEELQDSSS